MKHSLPAASLSALVLLSACSGTAHSRATAPHRAPASPARAAAATVAAPSAEPTPTRPDRLPDPLTTPLPVGSKTLYSGSGRGAGGVTLPPSARKASSVTVMWTCAGPAAFHITAAGKFLAGSGCGDGSAVFTAEILRAGIRRPVWKFSAADSVIWRVVVTRPGD